MALLVRRYRYSSIVLFLAVVGCGPEKIISLEEPKQITAGFSRLTFVAPPRKIGDIVSALEEPRSTDEVLLSRLRGIADGEAPATANAEARVKFFLERARAARRLGRARQEIADYREVVKIFGGEEKSPLRTRAAFELGMAEVRAGNFSRGLALIRKSLESSDELKQDAGFGVGASGLTDIYARSGDFSKADGLLAETEDLLSKLDDIPDISEKDRVTFLVLFTQGKAAILDRKGELAEAEAAYRDALETWRKFKDASPKLNEEALADNRIFNLLLTRLADNLRRQGRYVEAEVESRRALLGALRIYGKYSSQVAAILRTLTQAIYEQGRYDDAEILSRTNLGILGRAGVSPASLNNAMTRSLLGDILVARERWREARDEFQRMEADLKEDPIAFERFMSGNVNWALVHLRAGQSGKALGILEKALERSLRFRGGEDIETAEIRGFMATANKQLGNDAFGLDLFKKAVPILMRGLRDRNFGKRVSSVHDRRFDLILESYIDLLVEIRGKPLEADNGIDGVAEAFRLADVLRGRAVQQALSASASRAATKNPDLADIVRREQDSRTRISALESLLTDMLASPPGQRPPGSVANLNSRLGDLRAARTALLSEIRDRFPDYKNLIAPEPPTIRQAQEALVPGEALIAIYVGVERTYVWAVPQKGDVAFSVVHLGHEDLADMVGLARSALEPGAVRLGEIPDFDLTTGYVLYRDLLEPVKKGWQNSSSLLVVKDGPLGYLPLPLLPTRPVKLGGVKEVLFDNYKEIPWLARTHAVTVVPSASSLKTLRQVPQGPAGRKPFIGFGDPYFSAKQASEASQEDLKSSQALALASRGVNARGLRVRLRAAPDTGKLDSAELARLPRLPDTAEEIRSIALALKADLAEDVFLGSKANEENVNSTDLSKYKVVAFATHGLTPGDLNGLAQPALALSAPEVSGTGGDGILTMEEVLGLRLDADWVVLSACNTAAGDGAGAGAFTGLGRAFFFAGTRSVLLSNWPVQSSSAKELTTDLFRRQAEDARLTRAEALRRAMLAMIDGGGFADPGTGKIIFSYAHPIFWAPFSLVGDGGGGGTGNRARAGRS